MTNSNDKDLCKKCGGAVAEKLIEHDYSEECGLDVKLRSVPALVCESCGAYTVRIPGIFNLHRTIAKQVATKHERLAPREVKFLRKYLGYCQEDFAQLMGVADNMPSRWENGSPLNKQADRLIRVLVLSGAFAGDYEDLLKSIESDSHSETRIKLDVHDWAEPAAAAE